MEKQEEGQYFWLYFLVALVAFFVYLFLYYDPSQTTSFIYQGN